jgi:hypothetical protein
MKKPRRGGRGFFGSFVGGTHGWGGNTHLMQTAYHTLMEPRGTFRHSLKDKGFRASRGPGSGGTKAKFWYGMGGQDEWPRDLDCQHKTAFVLAHKIREAMAAETNGLKLSGEVELDGAYFGGHVRPLTRSKIELTAA